MALTKAVNSLDLWERIWVPGASEKGPSGLDISVSGSNSAKLMTYLSVEEAMLLVPVITKILEDRVEQADSNLADASFATSFPDDEDKK
jgi:hypothetical protein